MGVDERSASFESAQCVHLQDKPYINEDFFKCGVIHELLPSERVDGLCQTKIWRKCEYIYDPTRAWKEGKWRDVVGLDVVKRELVQKVQHPLLFYKKYSTTGVLPQKVILLFGPDGCGKARLSKVLAHESGAHLETLIPREIDRLKTLVEEAKEPTIIFLDEVDMVAQPVEYFQQRSLPLARDPVLVLMDSIETLDETNNPVALIMATDHPKLILRTLLKQDYIPEIMYVPPPTLQEREEIIRKFLKSRPLKDVDFSRLAELTRDFSILDIKKFIRNLELEWLERSFKEPQPVEITMSQLLRQIKDVVPSLSNALISQYEQAAKRWGAMEEELRRKREKKLTWEDVGGYIEVKEQLKDIVAVLEEANETVSQYNLKPPSGIILYGPPGCGKTYIANVLASVTKANFHTVTAGSLLSKWYGEAEQNITELFATAKVDPPSIIFFDELEGLFQTRGEASPVHSRIVSVFLQELSNLTPEDRVIVIGATNRPQDVDMAFLRPRRFDELIGIGLPDLEARKAIFKVHTKDMPLTDDIDLNLLAEKTEMFTGAEIAFICDTARKAVAKEALKSGFRKIKMEDFVQQIIQAKPGLTEDDVRLFNEAQERFGRRKYAPKKKIIEKEKELSWKDVGGYADVKDYMKNLVKILESEELFEKYGLKPPKGLLLYGPPGCGKSYLSKVLAAETDANFKVISAGIMMSKFYGETEKQIHDLFVQARRNPPTILFFDELEGLFVRREAIGTGFSGHKTAVSTLLTELSELKAEDRVLVIGATNRPQDIDPAFLRPGRFDERIGIGPPDLTARKAIFEVHVRGMPLAKDVDFDFLALKTEKYTGAEIEYICNQTRRKVAIEALKSGFREVKMEDFLNQLEVTKSGLSQEDIRLYEEAQERFERQLISISKQKVWEDVTFEQIGGLSEVKEFLKNYVGFLVQHFDTVRTSGLSSRGGIILFGPPGCGKTVLIKAAVRDANVNFFKFSALELRIAGGFNKFSDMLRDAEKVAPSIVALDDLESTKSIATQDTAMFIASELEKIPKETPLIVFCETSDLAGMEYIMPVIEYILPVPPPNAEARREILEIKTKKLDLENVDLVELARQTKYFTGADLEKLCREALRISFTKQTKGRITISMDDFRQALAKVEPSLSEEQINSFRRQMPKIQQNKFPLRKHVSQDLYS